MGILRLVSASTKKIDLGEEGDWIEVKSDISKQAFVDLLSSLPNDVTNAEGGSDLSIAQAMEFQKNLFETFIVDWSVVDEKGKKVAASVENYLQLGRAAAEVVDTAIAAHFDTLTPSKDDVSKSDGPSAA